LAREAKPTGEADKPLWYIILFFIPFVNIIAAVLVMHGVATNFGKGVGYTIGLLFLGFIFIPLLGFGDAQYMGHDGEPEAPAAA
jgi:hypothetical protein